MALLLNLTLIASIVWAFVAGTWLRRFAGTGTSINGGWIFVILGPFVGVIIFGQAIFGVGR